MDYYRVIYNLYPKNEGAKKETCLFKCEKHADESIIKNELLKTHNGLPITIIDRKEIVEEQFEELVKENENLKVLEVFQ
jgi:hypothetical protein